MTHFFNAALFFNSLRSAIFQFGLIVSLIIVGVLSLPLLLLPTKIAAPIILLWNRFILFWLSLCCGIRHEIKGNLDAIPSPCVVIANHQSPWETIFLQLHFYPLTTVLKRELLRIPFFGWGMRVLRPIAIDRSNPLQALKQIKAVGIERLTQGQNVLIFPEGSRQPAGQLGNFSRSGADMAKAAGVPIIVVAHNAGCYWKNKKLLKTSGVVKVTISDAIVVADQNTKEVMRTVRHWLEKTLS
ncbi:MAG: 1-acyl-sn-glycerol-3-phosphate acyltransferase [Kiritimatiellia bacterium]|jgi:1-acyl-sn-glycerol-3-phosphate acyltransferase